MRLLVVHADRFEFETVAPAAVDDEGTGRAATEADESAASGDVGDCLAVFVTVERADATDLDAAVANAAEEIRAVADRLGVGAVALYPTGHLSDDGAAAGVAATALELLGDDLDTDVEVLRVPVEWHAAFVVSSKGHPHAEQSVRVGPDRDAGRDGERAGTDDSESTERTVAFPDGELVDARDAVGSGRLADPMDSFVASELGDGPASDRESTGWDDRESTGASARRAVVDRLRACGLVEAAETDATDPTHAGSLGWLPRGALARDLLEDRLTGLAVEYGATVVDSPERLATEPGGAERAAADRDDRPRRRYGLARRRSPEGGPAFSTPEIRAATPDSEQARAELRAQVDRCQRAVESLGTPAVAAIRTTREWYDENDALVTSLVAALGSPALLELSAGHRAGQPLAVELALVDDAGAPVVTGRVEYEPSEEAEGVERVRATPVDGVERALAAALGASDEDADRDSSVPTWLAPTQVRFVPVGDEHVDACVDLAGELDAAGVRTDVDDREATVGERIARAEDDRVPYYAVVGDRELADSSDRRDALAVTVRAEEREREMDLETLCATVREELGAFPRGRRYLPTRLAERPGGPRR